MSKKENTGLIISILIAAVLISSSIVFYALLSSSKPANPEADSRPSLEYGQQLSNSMEELADDDYYLGSEDAPLTVVEFSDYACYWCQEFHGKVFKQFKEEFIDKGIVKFVYRDFPAKGDASIISALGANCAASQGDAETYFEFHDKIFETAALDRSSILEIAKGMSLNIEDFEKCLDDPNSITEIKKDYDDAISLGVNGTPNFIVNGYVIPGFLEFEAFKAELNKVLNAG